MILVDTSVFIQSQRRPNSDDAIELASLLARGEACVTGPVIMEYVSGARSDDESDFLIHRMSSLDYLEADRAVWALAGRIRSRLRRSGELLPGIDVAIAATAIRHDVELYTLDNGFARISELKLYRPPQN